MLVITNNQCIYPQYDLNLDKGRKLCSVGFSSGHTVTGSASITVSFSLKSYINTRKAQSFQSHLNHLLFDGCSPHR
jgi:hypothetical protein